MGQELFVRSIRTTDDVSNSKFAKLTGRQAPHKITKVKVHGDERDKELFITLLKATGRENADRVMAWLDSHGFFEAPASTVHHNNFKHGLLKHSLEVYNAAVELNKEAQLPETSVALCALSHDVCKSDQYYMGADGKPAKNHETATKGHGRRSMMIIKNCCAMPLNYAGEMAIWWHMGKYEESSKRFPRSISNRLICRSAS